MTRTRSAIRRTTAMSCVMKMTAQPVSPCNSLSKARISACTVASSAVVGSSAITSEGLHANAAAMTILCRMPPDNAAGCRRARVAASGMRTRSSSRSVSARAERQLMPRWVISVSAIWSPTAIIGSSALIGSWKIIPMRLPRTVRRSFAGMPSRSRPSNSALPAADLGRRARQQSHDRLHGDALAGSRFADDGEELARCQVEAEIVDDGARAGGRQDPCRQSLHRQQGGGVSPGPLLTPPVPASRGAPRPVSEPAAC